MSELYVPAGPSLFVRSWSSPAAAIVQLYAVGPREYYTTRHRSILELPEIRRSLDRHLYKSDE